MPGFPNFFFVFGPYGYTGSSYLALIENQTRHITRCIRAAIGREAKKVEVRQEANDRYFASVLKRRYRQIFWQESCSKANSYYFDHNGDAPLRPTTTVEPPCTVASTRSTTTSSPPDGILLTMEIVRSSETARRRVGIVVFDGVKMLDFTGPAEVFVEANQFGGNYEVVVMSPTGGDVATSVGVRVSTTPVHDSGGFDTVIVAGSEIAPPLFVTPELIEATRDLATRTRRMSSVCTGSFVLAEAGLLDGRSATTHWKFTADLAHRFPEVQVDSDAIYVSDGNIYSSAGVVAGIDLSLALVEEDHGAEVARRTAQGLLVYMQRGGGQSQFSSSLTGPAPRTSLVRKATDHIRGNPQVPHTVSSIAAHVNVSVRQLTRLFRDELGATPAGYVADTRFEIARDKLHAGLTVGAAAQAAGYGSAEVMRRAFVARIGISPRRYQQRFSSTGALAG